MEWIKSEKFQKWEWVLLAGIIMVLSSLYLYNDLCATSAAGLNVWYSLSEGKLDQFYEYLYPGVEDSLLPEGVRGGAYDFCIYLIFAIYNFPLWIWEKLTGCSAFMFYPTRLYVKSIVWVFIALSGFLIYKIALECKVEKNLAKWCPAFFMSSGLLFYSEVIVGSYEIISLTFTLSGIYFYMKKKRAGFILSFGVAIACKMFALWIFIPLLLLREKRIFHLILNCIEALMFIVVPKFLFAVAGRVRSRLDAVSQNSLIGGALDEVRLIASNGAVSPEEAEMILQGSTAEQAQQAGSVLAHSNLINEFLFPPEEFRSAVIVLHNLPLVFVGMFAIWIICYFVKRELDHQKLIYLCLTVMSVFFLTAKVHPYWIILLVPYLILVMFFNYEKLKKNIILELLVIVSYVCRMNLFWPGCSSLQVLYYMAKPAKVREYVAQWGADGLETFSLAKVFTRLGNWLGISIENISSIFGALFLVSLMFFLVLNFPKERAEENIAVDYGNIRKGYLFRLAISVGVGLLPFVGYALLLWHMARS